MHRFARLAATALVGIASLTAVAADETPGPLVDCEPDSDVTYVVEGEVSEQTVLGAPMTFPVGDLDMIRPEQDPTGGVILTAVRVHELYAANYIDGNRPTMKVRIDWDGVGDVDLDIFDEDGNIVADGHNFNTYDTDTFEETQFSPEACATYDFAITNNLATPASNITITVEVTSRAPRGH